MNNKKTLIILVLVFVLVIAGASVLYNKLGDTVSHDQLATEPASTDAQESTGQELIMAPDFTVYDINGNEVHLSDYFCVKAESREEAIEKAKEKFDKWVSENFAYSDYDEVNVQDVLEGAEL